MLVADLSHLVDIWKLVVKDPSTTTITLDHRGAHIEGAHVGASRKLKLPLDEPATVDGAMLLGTLALMQETAEISIERTDASIVLVTRGRRAVLRRIEGSPPLGLKQFEARFFNGRRLRDQLAFLRACTSGGVIRPILTGIRFTHRNQAILEATDAEVRSGRVLLKLPCTVSGQVVPAVELEQALSLLNERVAMKFTRSHLNLRDKITIIRIALLQGEYPSLDRLTKRSAYAHQVELKRTQLETAIKAGLLLDSDRRVTLSIKSGKGSLLVTSQETGGFRQSAGRMVVPDIDIVFDAHWLDAAQYLGDTLTLHYIDAHVPVLFTGSGRSLWMGLIART